MHMPACALPQMAPTIAPACTITAPGARARDEDFRQLRHQTKNALQRLLQIVDNAPELHGDGGRALRDSLQHRILVTADLSDALFGFTRDPGDIKDRLRHLSLGLVELLGEEQASIDVLVDIEGACPSHLHDVILRIAHELVGNAVRHGMYQRLIGTIAIRVCSTADGTTLTVVDDGWGCSAAEPRSGEGLSIVELLLLPHHGEFRIARRAEHTIATAAISPFRVAARAVSES